MLFLWLPLVCAALPGQEVAPGDPDARLEQALRAELARTDPLAAGWESEGRGAGASGRLKELGKLLKEPRGDLVAALEELVDEDVVCTPLRPIRLRAAFADPAFRVLRADPAEVEEPLVRGAEGFARALLSLRGSFDPGPVRTKFKVTGVAEAEGGFATRVRFEAFGRAADGDAWIQQRAVWSCRWREPGEGAAPRLAGVELLDFEHVRAPELLFDDRSEGLLGDLTPDPTTVGVGEWRRRLDVRLGLPLLGHPAGIAIGDVDGNGLEDLYLCQTGGVPNQLYLRNRDGSLRNASRGSGADFLDFSRSALMLDLDGDEDRDLVVLVGQELLFLANQDGQDKPPRFAVAATVPALNTTSLAAADYDRDGDLDLYACAYFDTYAKVGGSFPLPYHDANNGQANLMLENRGDFEWVDVTAEVGLDANNSRFSFAAAWEDYDRDGDPDLYVANDFGRNNLYRNDGGEFVDVAAQAGVEDISAGMGVSWGDYDGDGFFDLYVSNMYSSAGNRVTYQRQFGTEMSAEARGAYQRHARGNTLFRNRGDGTFEDVSETAGVTMGRWAWGSRFVDLNNDGRLDVLVPNGFLTHAKSDDL